MNESITAAAHDGYVLVPEAGQGNKAIDEVQAMVSNHEIELPVMFQEMELDAALDELDQGRAAAVIAGATRPSGEVIIAGARRFNPKRNEKGELDESGERQRVSSYFKMIKDGEEPLVLTDCAVVVNPTAADMVDIASLTCRNVARSGIEPVVAFLSFSTHGSGKGESAVKATEAARLFSEAHPDIPNIGDVQWDAARRESIYELKTGNKYPGGKQPNVIVMPNLETGNSMYKSLEIDGGWTAIGPLLQGFEHDRQLHDLSRGVTTKALIAIIRDVARTSGLQVGN
jgi:phosphotransacetylase